MGPHTSRIDTFNQACVLVNQPRFPQHVCRGVLQLQQSVHHHCQSNHISNLSVAKMIFGIVSMFHNGSISFT